MLFPFWKQYVYKVIYSASVDKVGYNSIQKDCKQNQVSHDAKNK